MVSNSWWLLTEEWGSQDSYLRSNLNVNNATCIFCGDNIPLTDRNPSRVQTFGTNRTSMTEWYSHFIVKHHIFESGNGYMTKARCWWPH